MRITKFTHACLLIETEDRSILVDPGEFTKVAGQLDINALDRLDTVVVTHEHPDHFDTELTKQIIAKFPDVQFITTIPVSAELHNLGARHVTSESANGVEVFSHVKHASLEPLGVAPDNIAVHLLGKVTVGGDRHDLEHSKDVLALTVTAPWGSIMQAAAMADRLKPKTIIPVHDWHWNEQARAGAYDRLEDYYGAKGIAFMKPVNGQPMEV